MKLRGGFREITYAARAIRKYGAVRVAVMLQESEVVEWNFHGM